MSDTDSCQEKILSENYRDFIVSDVRMPFLKDLFHDNYCLQDPGFFLPVRLYSRFCGRSHFSGTLLLFFYSKMLFPAQYAGAQ